MSAFEAGPQRDGSNIICPHCGYEYQADAEDNDESERVEECYDCGKEFAVWAEISIDYCTREVRRASR